MRQGVRLGYYFLKNIFWKIDFPIAISIDVTNKCNLRCKHCYFWRQNYTKELTDRELLAKIKEIKKKFPSIIQASWVGGEPLLRKDLVEKGIKFFPFNMVVTNGTLPLPKWKNVVFNVSIDGTKEYYEKIRGPFYDEVRKNADRGDINVNIVCVLNKKNVDCIEPMLKEWSFSKVRGINFDFYTPIKGIKEDLWLSWDERDRAVNKILELKKRYKGFILNSNSVLELMKSHNSSKITSKCVLPKVVFCIDLLGKRKLPCVIGNDADCSRCGCMVPFQVHSILNKNKVSSFFVTKKLFT